MFARRTLTTVLATALTAGGIAVALASPAAAINPCTDPVPPPNCTGYPPPPPPPAPAGPSAASVVLTAQTAVTISWQDNATTESVFQVMRLGGSGGSPVFTVPGRSGSGGRRSFTDTSASPATAYTYEVRAIRYGTARGQSSGVSAWSASTSTTTLGAGSPVNLGVPMSIGWQGSLNDCSAWAADYYLRGWYAWRDGYYPSGGFAPTYTYAQYDHGRNGGTTIDGNMSIQLQNGANGQPGLDTQADYYQGNYDSTDQPTAAEAANAAKYRIASYAIHDGPNLQSTIQSSIANGQPLALNITVFPDFMSYSGPTLITPPAAGTASIGSHGVFAYAVDANGVWVANQWSPSWRQNGTAELSWAFVNADVGAAYTMVPVTPAGM